MPFSSGRSKITSSGSQSGYLSTGNLQGALIGAVIGGISAGIFSAIGTATEAGKITFEIGALLKGTVNGILTVVQGGKFGHGFASTFISTVGAPTFITGSGAGAVVARTVYASALGGTISSGTGGKFGNGAVTSAFAHLFNFESTFHEKDHKITFEATEELEFLEIELRSREVLGIDFLPEHFEEHFDIAFIYDGGAVIVSGTSVPHGEGSFALQIELSNYSTIEYKFLYDSDPIEIQINKTPNDKTPNDVAQAILKGAKFYQKNNRQMYRPLPEPAYTYTDALGREAGNYFPSYNSNGFAHGLLNLGGVTIIDSKFSDPIGFSHPVPKNCFTEINC